MTKLHYQELAEFCNERITHFKAEIEKARIQYIEDNRIFKDGDKIVITTPEHPVWRYIKGGNGDSVESIVPETKRFAFVKGVNLDFKNDLRYQLFGCKLDGQPSKLSDHYGDRDILTLAE